jgi:hypothetical protein
VANPKENHTKELRRKKVNDRRIFRHLSKHRTDKTWCDLGEFATKESIHQRICFFYFSLAVDLHKKIIFLPLKYECALKRPLAFVPSRSIN